MPKTKSFKSAKRKQIIISTLLVLLLSVSCESVKDRLMNAGPFKNFNWLIGSWKRTNDSAPQQTYEHWKKQNDSLYLGHGYTMVNTDTIWQEYIELVYEKDRWYFKVTGQKDSASTDFELSRVDSIKFTCFNLKNDFPTHISYHGKGDSLKALISGDSLEVQFNFIRY